MDRHDLANDRSSAGTAHLDSGNVQESGKLLLDGTLKITFVWLDCIRVAPELSDCWATRACLPFLVDKQKHLTDTTEVACICIDPRETLTESFVAKAGTPP